MIKAYFEGICNPNADGGKMIYETIIYRNYTKAHDCHEVLDRYTASNNIAEYAGLIAVLLWIKSEKITDENIYIFTDSKLVEGQMMKDWNMKEGKYKKYAIKAFELINELTCHGNDIRIEWKPVKRDMMSLPLLLGGKDNGVSGSTGKCNDITQLFIERQNKLFNIG